MKLKALMAITLIVLTFIVISAWRGGESAPAGSTAPAGIASPSAGIAGTPRSATGSVPAGKDIPVSPAEPTETPPSSTISIPGTNNIPALVIALSPSVVHIQTEAVSLDQFNRPVPVRGVGTGIIIDDKGHILTNNHVIAGAERILVTMIDGRAVGARLIGGDPALDLAVVKVPLEGLIPVRICDSNLLRVGEQVVAVGHALNLPGGPTVTSGLVSALDRSISFSETVSMQHLIQTDAAINPGNSGGALVNMDGELVGINTAKIQGGEGIGFAIAIGPAMPLVHELIAAGRIERGFLGVSGVNVTEALAINFDLPVTSGVGIASVAPESPADVSGTQAQRHHRGCSRQTSGQPGRVRCRLDPLSERCFRRSRVLQGRYKENRKRHPRRKGRDGVSSHRKAFQSAFTTSSRKSPASSRR